MFRVEIPVPQALMTNANGLQDLQQDGPQESAE
jgi:hypothetical protein